MVEHLPLAQGVVLEFQDQVHHRAPCMEPASSSAYVSASVAQSFPSLARRAGPPLPLFTFPFNLPAPWPVPLPHPVSFLRPGLPPANGLVPFCVGQLNLTPGPCPRGCGVLNLTLALTLRGSSSGRKIFTPASFLPPSRICLMWDAWVAQRLSVCLQPRV